MTVCKQEPEYFCQTELFEIELFLRLNVYSYKIKISETIKLCAKNMLRLV